MSDGQKAEISQQIHQLQIIIKESLPLLSKKLHLHASSTITSDIQKEFISKALEAQNARREKLHAYLEHHAEKDVYKKIHTRLTAGGDLRVIARAVIGGTKLQIAFLLWFNGELLVSLIKEIRLLRAKVKDIISQPAEDYWRFFFRTAAILRELETPIKPDDAHALSHEERIRIRVHSKGTELARVRN